MGTVIINDDNTYVYQNFLIFFFMNFSLPYFNFISNGSQHRRSHPAKQAKKMNIKYKSNDKMTRKKPSHKTQQKLLWKIALTECK